MSVRSELIEVRVARKVVEAEDIVSLDLVSASGALLPPFEAGAHVDVHVPAGEGLVRQYSLCNPPGERHRYSVCILKDASTRGGSLAMHEQVHHGSLLWISAPRNRFELVRGARHSILLAGGIGVTPLLAMAEQLERDGADFELHYSCRTAARMALRDRLAASPYANRVRLHFDDGPSPQRLDLEQVLKRPFAGTHVYVCGPAGFITACTTAARTFGWPSDQIHSESFSGSIEGCEENGAFEVKLARSGRVIQITAAQTVAEALAEHGVEIPMSCEQGICGTCVTTVIEGEPEHRDMYFTPDEHARNDRFTPCCSRSKTPCLVVDL